MRPATSSGSYITVRDPAARESGVVVAGFSRLSACDYASIQLFALVGQRRLALRLDELGLADLDGRIHARFVFARLTGEDIADVETAIVVFGRTAGADGLARDGQLELQRADVEDVAIRHRHFAFDERALVQDGAVGAAVVAQQHSFSLDDDGAVFAAHVLAHRP